MQNNSFIELKKNCLSGEQMQDLNADSNWMEPWSNGAQGKKLSVCWSYGSAFTSFWAADSKGTKSCRTQGESVCPYIRTSVIPSVPPPEPPRLAKPRLRPHRAWVRPPRAWTQASKSLVQASQSLAKASQSLAQAPQSLT